MSEDIDKTLDAFMGDTNSDSALDMEESVEETQEQTPQPAEVPQPTPQPAEAPKDDMVQPDEYELGEFSDQEKKENKLRPEDMEDPDDIESVSNKTFVIEAVDDGRASLLRLIKGGAKPEPFNKDNPESVGFRTRLRIDYKDAPYVSLIPNIRWYPGINEETGKKRLNPWFSMNVKEADLSNNMISTISKLYYKYCGFVGKEVGKVTLKEFIEGLVGRTVKLKTWGTNYKGKDRFRIDIDSILA